MEERRKAIEAKRTMKPSLIVGSPLSKPLNVKPDVDKKLQKLPNLKPIILSPHLVKLYKHEQKAQRRKERILDLIEEHEGSTRDLHHQSSRTAFH